MTANGWCTAPRRIVERLMAVRARGFTLIELMVAIAIMALLLMAVSPSLNDWAVNLISVMRRAPSNRACSLPVRKRSGVIRYGFLSGFSIGSRLPGLWTIPVRCPVPAAPGWLAWAPLWKVCRRPINDRSTRCWSSSHLWVTAVAGRRDGISGRQDDCCKHRDLQWLGDRDDECRRHPPVRAST